MTLAPGTSLGPFEIVAPLGAGGMGEVYRAKDTRLGREVAIKVLPEGLAQDPERLARFEREAKLLATLHHPNIAGIHGIEHQGAERYLILELVPGESLAQRLARGPLPLDEALDVGRQIALALEAAHENGVVHRDLKPGNVMLTPNGEAKVLDFGLAKSAAAPGAGSDAHLSASPTMTYAATMAGTILGTAAYMSPEQARGKSVDRRTDIWSFGCVLYECLCAHQAFSGETVSDLVAQVLKAEPDWSLLPAETPAHVHRLLRLCLRKDPRERLRDIGDARLELSGAGESLAAPAATAALVRQAPRWPLALAGLALGAALTALLAPFWHHVPATGAVREASVLLPYGQRLAINGANGFLAIAPDARAVAFSARLDGRVQIHVRRLDTREEIVLPGTDQAHDPFFSRDGEQLGYFDAQSLYKVSVHGGEPVALAPVTEDRGGAFLPDGSIIATLGPSSPLVRVPRDGGTPVAVTKLDTTRLERTHRWPALLGEGPWVAFTVGLLSAAGDYDHCTIDAVSLKSGERRTLLREARHAFFVAPDRIVFDRKGTLFTVHVDPRDPKVTDEPVPVLDGVAGDPSTGATFADFANDGTLAWVPERTTNAEWQIGTFDRAGHWTDLKIENSDFRATSISPDGRKLLLLQGGSGSGDNWVADLASGALQQVTNTHGVVLSCWMPDGQSIAYTSVDAKGEWLVILQRIDGVGGEHVLHRGTQIQTLGGSLPDGSAVLVSDWGGVGGRSYLVSTKGDGGYRMLTGAAKADCYEVQGQLSPDGKLFTYVSNVSGHGAVYVRRVDGTGGAVQVTPGIGGGMRWGRTNHELFYIESEKLYSVALSEDAAGLHLGTPKLLFETPPSPIQAQIRDHCYDPIGDRFFFIRPKEGTDELREIALSIGFGGRLDALVKRGPGKR